jgi:hypothetical protein
MTERTSPSDSPPSAPGALAPEKPREFDRGRLPTPIVRPRDWIVEFLSRERLLLPAAKLVSADSAWVKFKRADGTAALYPTGQLLLVEEAPTQSAVGRGEIGTGRSPEDNPFPTDSAPPVPPR